MWSSDVEGELARRAAAGAKLAAAVAGLALVVAVAGEILRPIGRAAGVVATLDRYTPAAIRSAASAIVAAIVGLGAPAGAATGDPPPTTTSTVSVAGAVRDWLSPTSTTLTTSTVAPPAVVTLTSPPLPVPSPANRYVVRPGDCLWTIAARHLAAGGTKKQIDRAWRRLYAANRGVIGRDPNLIHPRVTLTLPPASPPHAPEEPDA